MGKRESIPDWEVQQAFPIEKYPIKPGTWFSVTQKVNGVRATYYKGRMIGRKGTVIPGLEHIENVLSTLGDYVFDGELMLKDTSCLSDNEAFRKVSGIINSDSEDKSEVGFSIFDMVPTSGFDDGTKCDATYRSRRELLENVSKKLFEADCVEILPVLYQGTDQKRIDSLLDLMISQDKEGLMINLDTPYLRRRHRGILKVKRFYTMDLPIVGFEEGTGRLTGTLGAVVVDYIGTRVGVGTGFTDQQRRQIWENRDDLYGTIIEVKYKEISSDKTTGKKSLQFPTFVMIRDDKSEVSYG